MRRRERNIASLLISAVLFAAVLGVMAEATRGMGGGADEEGVRATREAVERAAVLCYATEGFYPPGLDYIEENYGVSVDEARYAVRYETFSYNVRPAVTVAARERPY